MNSQWRLSYFLIYLSFLYNRPKFAFPKMRIAKSVIITAVCQIWLMSQLVNHISSVYSHFPRWILTGVSALGILTWLLILWFCLQLLWKMLCSSTFLFTVLQYITLHCSLCHFSWLSALIWVHLWHLAVCCHCLCRCSAVRFLRGSVLLLCSQVSASVKGPLRCKFWKLTFCEQLCLFPVILVFLVCHKLFSCLSIFQCGRLNISESCKGLSL